MRLLPAFFLVLAATVAHAQAPAPEQPQPPLEGRRNQKIEHLVVEDAGVRIDELRYAGQAQRITVQPKGGARAYEIQPGSGQRVWNVLNF